MQTLKRELKESKKNNKPLVQIDNTRMKNFPIPEEMMKIQFDLIQNNQKAIYTKEQCYSTKYGFISTGLDVRVFDNLSDDLLFWNFKNTAELWFARGELQGNLNRMISFFRANQGGIYEDEILTKHIVQHPNTSKYCQKVEGYIAEQLKNNFSKLEKVEDKGPYFLVVKDFENSKGKRDNKNKGFLRPSYSYGNPIKATKGLTIALNDIWATEVILQQVKFNNDNYTAKYKVTLWDHFGLDLPDMEKKFNSYWSIKEAFACWFILQHLRGYKPFVTKITFIKEFKGNLSKGINEIKTEREEKRQKEANEWAEKEMEKLRRRPKF